MPTTQGVDEFELLQMISESNTGWCVSEEAGPPKRMDCAISHRLKRGTKHLCEDEFRLLQMILEPDTGRCTIEEATPKEDEL